MSTGSPVAPRAPEAPTPPEAPTAPEARAAAGSPGNGGTTAGLAARSWLRLTLSELKIVFIRPRNLLIYAALAGAPVFLGIVLRISTPRGGGGGGGAGGPGGGAGALFGQVTGNGVFLSLLTLDLLLVLLLPVAVAVVSGDSVAGEAGMGTLRTMLTVPAGRTRLLVVKYVGIVVFCVAVTVLVVVVGLIMGALLFPVGRITLLSGDTISMAAGLGRVVLIGGYVTAALAALGAVGLALSTLTQYSLAVMAALLIIVVGSEITDAIPQVAAIHPVLPTHFWFSFDALLRMPIGWADIQHGLISFGCYIVIFGLIAWARLRRANITT